jgi:site-specific DNA-methyltransferase (adenine-specific)
MEYVDDGTRYPLQIIECNRDSMYDTKFHPTQKPVSLLENLIKTYTNEGETVLDFTMGSGSTGVACVNTNRNFIGIELNTEYYNIADKRINYGFN